jgi:hypothetical protein
MSEPVEREEIEAQQADVLPDREAMTIIRDPFQTPGIVPPTEPSDLE